MKLATVNGQPCVKISDDLTKASPALLLCTRDLTALPQNTGDKEVVAHVKRVFDLHE